MGRLLTLSTGIVLAVATAVVVVVVVVVVQVVEVEVLGYAASNSSAATGAR
jgi:hypothetical protein